jgi:hypothetical protein
MKILVTAVAAVGLLAASSFAMAQSSSAPMRSGSETSPNAAPDSADSPMHGTHDKGPATAVDNNNGLYSGRSSSEAPRTGLDDATTGTH